MKEMKEATVTIDVSKLPEQARWNLMVARKTCEDSYIRYLGLRVAAFTALDDKALEQMDQGLGELTEIQRQGIAKAVLNLRKTRDNAYWRTTIPKELIPQVREIVRGH